MSRRAVLNALRRERERARERSGRSRTLTLPAPHQGWNARDPVQAIPPTQAERFTNVISSHDGISPRRNPLIHASISSSIEPTELMVHVGSIETMFCGADGGIWDVSSAGFVATPAVTGLTNTKFCWTNINGRLVWANGEDAPQSYDGAAWSTQPLSVASGEPAASADKFAGVYSFKNHTYWWRPDQLGFYYSTLDSIGDALRFFDLSYVARKGGDLLTMTRYTHDGGSGPDDYPVFVTTAGEAIVYQGTNPNDANAWALVGVFNLGEAAGIGAAMPQRMDIAASWGAQTWLITEYDYVALPQAMLTEGVVTPSKLAGAVKAAMNDNQADLSWQAVLYPKGPLLLFNVPVADSTWGDREKAVGTYHQHIVDLHTGAPSLFTGMNATSWAVFDGDLYYTALASASGDNTVICQAFATATSVSIEMISGPSNLRVNNPKSITAARLWASASANATLVPSTASTRVELKMNYTDNRLPQREVLRYNEWMLAAGVGTFVQMKCTGPVTPDAKYRHIDYVYEVIDPAVGFW